MNVKNGKIRAGIIGLGCRGNSMTDLLSERDDLTITAVCDVYDDRISMMQESSPRSAALVPRALSTTASLSPRRLRM